MTIAYALGIIGSLFIAAGLLTTRRTARYKSCALSAIGTGVQTSRSVLAGEQFWAGVFTVLLLLLVGATVSYYRQARKTGDAR